MVAPLPVLTLPGVASAWLTHVSQDSPRSTLFCMTAWIPLFAAAAVQFVLALSHGRSKGSPLSPG